MGKKKNLAGRVAEALAARKKPKRHKKRHKSRLVWLERKLKAAVKGALPSGATYSITVWCGEEQDAIPDDNGPFGWVTVAGGVSKWGLRRCFEVLNERGWSETSVSVSRDDG